MARTPDRLVTDLVDVAHALILEGTTDPRANELASKYYGSLAYSAGTVEDIRRKLARIRDELERKYKHQIYLVSSAYYPKFRKSPPITLAQARKCIPLGRGVRPEGLRLYQVDGEDFIWKAMIDARFSTGNGAVKKAIEKVATSFSSGLLGQASARDILESARRQRQPEQQQVIERIMAEDTRLLPGIS